MATKTNIFCWVKKLLKSSPEGYERLKKNAKNKKEEAFLRRFLAKNKDDTIFDTTLKLAIKIEYLESHLMLLKSELNEQKLFFLNLIDQEKKDVEISLETKTYQHINEQIHHTALYLSNNIQDEKNNLSKLFEKIKREYVAFDVFARINKLATILNQVTKILKENGLVENNTDTPKLEG